MLKFIIVQDAEGRYRWKCYEQSGGSVARSGACFYNKVDCMDAIQRIIHMLPANAQVEIEEATRIEGATRIEDATRIGKMYREESLVA